MVMMMTKRYLLAIAGLWMVGCITDPQVRFHRVSTTLCVRNCNKSFADGMQAATDSLNARIKRCTEYHCNQEAIDLFEIEKENLRVQKTECLGGCHHQGGGEGN